VEVVFEEIEKKIMSSFWKNEDSFPEKQFKFHFNFIKSFKSKNNSDLSELSGQVKFK
jgi:hypothetical protein